jgi:hypothetical protein
MDEIETPALGFKAKVSLWLVGWKPKVSFWLEHTDIWLEHAGRRVGVPVPVLSAFSLCIGLVGAPFMNKNAGATC